MCKGENAAASNQWAKMLLLQCALISTDHTLVSSHCQQSVWYVCVLSGARSFFSAFAHLLLYFHFPSALISSGQKRRTATSAEAPFFLSSPSLAMCLLLLCSSLVSIAKAVVVEA